MNECQVLKRSIDLSLVGNEYCDCGCVEENWCENEHLDKNTIQRQVSFLWQIHCRSKFHFYSLYANRTKDLSKNYSFEILWKFILSHWFLVFPVNRLSLFVDISRIDRTTRICSKEKCVIRSILFFEFLSISITG